jgi:hypothetical protein
VVTNHAYIINPLGQVLDRTGWRKFGHAAHTVDLDCIVAYFDWHDKALPELKAKFGAGVEIRILGEEGYFMVTARKEGLGIDQVTAEVPVMPASAFFAKHVRDLRAARETASPDP